MSKEARDRISILRKLHRARKISFFVPVSATRLGNFRNVFGTIFLTKVAQIYFCFWANLKNVTIKLKTNAATFGATFGNN